MTQINVPIINQNPDTIVPVFQSEYAISVEAANPYLLVDNLTSGTTPTLAQAVAACQPGGPGWLGGPECVTLLQRAASYSAVPTTGFAYETFTLPQYPDHTFYTFNNYVTGKKSVVCFSNSGAPVPTDTVPVISAHAFATTLTTDLVTTATLMPGGTYAWGLTGGTITAGQGTNSITWTAGVAGDATFTCTYTNASGIAAPACTPAVTTIVAVPALAIISGSATVTVGVNEQVTVIPQAGCTYVWTASRGTITFGQGTPAMSYGPGAAGTNNVNCAITNQAGTTTNATQKVVTIIAAPTVPVITIGSPVAKATSALVASVVPQAGCTYLWTMSNKTAIVDATLATISYTSAAAGGTNNVNCTVSNAATIPATAAAVEVVQTINP